MITLEAKNYKFWNGGDSTDLPHPHSLQTSTGPNSLMWPVMFLCSGLPSSLQPTFSLISLPWAWILINYLTIQFIQWFLTYWSLSKKSLSWPGTLLYPLSSFTWLVPFHSCLCLELIPLESLPWHTNKMWHPSRASWNFLYYSIHHTTLQFSLYLSRHSLDNEFFWEHRLLVVTVMAHKVGTELAFIMAY